MPETADLRTQPQETVPVSLEDSITSSLNQEAPALTEDNRSSNENEQTTEPESDPDKGKTPLDHIDPSTLPPELQAVYRNLQKGFTQGRQKDREEVNALKAELEALKKQLTPEEPEEPLDPVEARVQEILAQRESQAFVQQAQEGYANLDPRLNRESETYNELLDFVIGAKLDQALDQHLEAGNPLTSFDYQKEGKAALEAFDALVESLVEERVAQLKSEAQKSLAKAKRLAPESSKAPVTPNSSMSLEDAIRHTLAEKR